MGDTSIEWTDATWNPVTGCTKVSPGCKLCYAERVFPRPYGGICKCGHIEAAHDYNDMSVGLGVPSVCFHEGCNCALFVQRKFTDVRTHEDRLEQPLHWKKPRRIFVNSMSDLFHEDVPEYFIDQVFAIMGGTQWHTYQILTKRPDRMRAYMNDPELPGRVDCLIEDCINSFVDPLDRRSNDARATAVMMEDGPLPNVWLGVSVENQQYADERIPLLLQTPAAVRFVSYEPALGPVNFRRIEVNPPGSAGTVFLDVLAGKGYSIGGTWGYPQIDWLIVGGESGPGARPFNLQWGGDVVLQCKAAGAPVFVKQMGSNPLDYTCHIKGDLKDRKGGDMSEWPEDLRIRQFPEVRQ